jgi:8-oxo-dGTP diphosphatase
VRAVNDQHFRGCKLALVHDGNVLVYTRDDKAGIPWPGMVDLPGGGREGAETPEECVLRELHEEFGLRLPCDRLEYRRRYASAEATGFAWFFGGRLLAEEIAGIVFGNEGTHWRLLRIDEFLAHPRAIPHLQSRLRDYLDAGRVMLAESCGKPVPGQ